MAIGENGTPEKPARKKPKHQEDKRAFLPPLNLENLKWDSEHRAGSLEKAFCRATDRAGRALDTYSNSINKYKWRAKLVRRFQLILITSAGILLLVSTGWVNESGKPYVSTAFSAILFAVAAGLVAWDHFFGYSSSWMRYTKSHRRLSMIVNTFQIEWQSEISEFDHTPTHEQVKYALDKVLKKFQNKVDTMLLQETMEWIAEFTRQLSKLDEGPEKKA